MHIAYHRRVQLSRRIINAEISNKDTMGLLKYLLKESKYYHKRKQLFIKYNGEALRIALIIHRLHTNNLIHGTNN